MTGRTIRDVEITYADAQAPLEALLQSIERPGDYCTQGRLFVPMPRVEVGGAGMLSFPVTPPQAQALTSVAERAPYGRGVETLVDSSVRACWQIDAAQVTVGGGVWRDTLAQIVAHAATGLGCPPEHTEAHLYKLLVYEAGGFFAAHRDTEKVDGMVATLVLSLPVAGAGGELVISHKQRQTRVDLRTEEPSELAFAAFYADCIHETLPVSAGHRIVLVYLLVLQQGAAADALRTAPDYTAQEARIAAQLREWDTGPVDGSKLVWLLEHDYSTAGLSLDFASRLSLGLTERGVPLCAMPRAPPAMRCRRLWAPTPARIRQPTLSKTPATSERHLGGADRGTSMPTQSAVCSASPGTASWPRRPRRRQRF